VRLRVPTWGRVDDPLGGPVSVVGAPAVEGPGHIDELTGVAPSTPISLADDWCYRGYRVPGAAVSGVKVTLPANSSTTLVFSGAIAPTLWPDSDLRVGFQVAERAAGDLTDPADETPLTVPEHPRITQPLGTRVVLRVGSGPLARVYGAITRLGRVVSITGTTDPALPGHPVVLSATGAGEVARHLASATTDQAGRFTYTWRPTRLGRFRISAGVTPTDPARASDRSCPQSATVTAADGSVEAERAGVPVAWIAPNAIARISANRGRVNEAGWARIPITCDAQVACRGQLLLRSRGTTLAEREFLLAPGTGARLRVSLSRPARDQVRRRGRLRVLAVLRPGRYRHVTLRR
jgi:hypothetical protein